MKRVLYMIISLNVFMLTGCHRRPLDEVCETTSRIPIGTVWDKSEVKAQNVTAYFYNQTDGALIREHRFENTSQEIQSYVSLPFGNYTVIVHNEIREQIKNVSVQGYENLSTLEFFSHPDLGVKHTRSQEDAYIMQPDPIATAIVRGVSVEPNIENHQLIGIETEQKNSYMYITVHIKGINNAHMPALVDLRNVATSFFIEADNPSNNHSTIQFKMNNRKYDDGSDTDGTISAVVALHGTLGDRLSVVGHKEKPIFLDLRFMLVDKDKTVITRTIDITKLISFSKVNNGSVHLNLNLNLDEALPDIEPEDGSGMGSDIIDWEGEDIDIEL